MIYSILPREDLISCKVYVHDCELVDQLKLSEVV